MTQRVLFLCFLLLISLAAAEADPPKLTILHFDVNVGDATLIISPDGHAVLIDCGDEGRGVNPVMELLDRWKASGHIAQLDYTIATHYDADHIGGFPELFAAGWYPELQAIDRGDVMLPRFSREDLNDTFSVGALDTLEQLAPWGTAPEKYCKKPVSEQFARYILTAQRGGKRTAAEPGMTLTLDHDIRLTVLAVNGRDIDGDSVEIFFPGRLDNCAMNDLSVAVLLEYGDFRYLVAGDLTGVREDKVADVEELIIDDAKDVDVYQLNHHGSSSSSSLDFLQSIHPTVAVCSSGKKYNHPRREVVEDRLYSLAPKPAVYVTNTPSSGALSWQAPESSIADSDGTGYDGMIELKVWKRSYRVYRWRDGAPLAENERYIIKRR